MGRQKGSRNKSGNGDTVRAASKTLILSLVRRSNECKTRMQSIAGELDEEIKYAVEDKHLHAGALKLIAKLSRMDPLKRDDFLRAYHLYWTYAEEGGLFGEKYVGDLVDDAEAVSVGDVAETVVGVVEENVKKLRRGIGDTSQSTG